MKSLPLKMFFSYAHEDHSVRDELDKHLDVLEREGLITVWWDGQITAGARWSDAIAEQLRASDIIIFLVTPRFFESAFITANELPLALEVEKTSNGQRRVISVLVEPTKQFAHSELSKLQRLPAGDVSLSECEDRVQALHHVVVQIRRAVMDIVVEAGGAFEFGPHAFTQAELAELEAGARAQTTAGLRRLYSSLIDSVPRRRLDRNLLVASWALARGPRANHNIESLFYLAQVVSAFDIVSLQKVSGNLEGMKRLLTILGPEWGYLISDVTLGAMGTYLRFAILYYRPRVTFEHVSGGLVLPVDALIEGQQLARTPLLASFSASGVRFRICAAHIRFGSERRLRTAECERIGQFLVEIANRDKEEILLTGDFNLLSHDSPALAILRGAGVDIPPTTVHPSHWISARPCDLIGHVHGGPTSDVNNLTMSTTGMLDVFDSVFRTEDFQESSGESDDPTIRAVRKSEISDHLPIWVEYSIAGEGSRERLRPTPRQTGSCTSKGATRTPPRRASASAAISSPARSASATQHRPRCVGANTTGRSPCRCELSTTNG